jgi:hypothetical protein
MKHKRPNRKTLTVRVRADVHEYIRATGIEHHESMGRVVDMLAWQHKTKQANKAKKVGKQ